MSVFNAIQYFQHSKNQLFHTQRILKARPTIDTTRPKSKLQCTKQPLSQFNRILQRDLQNKSLMKKLTNVHTSIDMNGSQFKIIKNNRKQYYREYSVRTQNQGLLRRIKSAKTSYSRTRLKSDRKDNEKYLNFLCKFGYKGKINSHFKYNVNNFSSIGENVRKLKQYDQHFINRNFQEIKLKKQQNIYVKKIESWKIDKQQKVKMFYLNKQGQNIKYFQQKLKSAITEKNSHQGGQKVKKKVSQQIKQGQVAQQRA